MAHLIHNKLLYIEFSKLLLQWNKNFNIRAMPWKGEKDPYKIWLSEIILQQTRVDQGLKYYHRFIENFKDIYQLAAAPEKEVFKLWEGLGYYSRCRNLIATARHIAETKKGVFPDTYEDILKLKGIGPYTAAAIASFAYNMPHAVIDGNVFRLLSRVFGIAIPIDSLKGKRVFTKLANDLLDKDNPAHYNQAIMDFGATVCKPVAPLCNTCVFNKHCEAYKHNSVSSLPVKEKMIRQKARFFYFFIIEYKKKIAVRERLEKDIWQHLYEFPIIEANSNAETETAIANTIRKGWLQDPGNVNSISGPFQQKLTHQTIKAFFIKVSPAKKPLLDTGFVWVTKETMRTIPFPKIINSYIYKNYL